MRLETTLKLTDVSDGQALVFASGDSDCPAWLSFGGPGDRVEVLFRSIVDFQLFTERCETALRMAKDGSKG